MQQRAPLHSKGQVDMRSEGVYALHPGVQSCMCALRVMAGAWDSRMCGPDRGMVCAAGDPAHVQQPAAPWRGHRGGGAVQPAAVPGVAGARMGALSCRKGGEEKLSCRYLIDTLKASSPLASSMVCATWTLSSGSCMEYAHQGRRSAQGPFAAGLMGCCGCACMRQEELSGMAVRIMRMRAELYQALQDVGAPGNWRPVTEAIGMFAMLGLSKVGFRPFHSGSTSPGLPGRAACPSLRPALSNSTKGLFWESFTGSSVRGGEFCES